MEFVIAKNRPTIGSSHKTHSEIIPEPEYNQKNDSQVANEDLPI
jgi:hypothetical protein